MSLNNKSLIEVTAVSLSFSLTILLAGIWFAAAVNGNQITVTINELGERNFELVMWAVVVPVLAVGIQHWYKRD